MKQFIPVRCEGLLLYYDTNDERYIAMIKINGKDIVFLEFKEGSKEWKSI